jgi:hypothetical protein
MTVFPDNAYLFPLSSETENMPLGWVLSAYTRGRLAVRAGRDQDCFGGQRFPAINNPVNINLLDKFMREEREDIRGAVDNWIANCSADAILRLKPSE